MLQVWLGHLDPLDEDPNTFQGPIVFLLEERFLVEHPPDRVGDSRNKQSSKESTGRKGGASQADETEELTEKKTGEDAECRDEHSEDDFVDEIKTKAEAHCCTVSSGVSGVCGGV